MPRAPSACASSWSRPNRARPCTARAKAEHALRRTQHGSRRAKSPQYTLAQARANRPRLDWGAYAPPVPRMLGVRSFDDYSIEELARYIDWTPFFQAWELRGRFPDILNDAQFGEQASSLYADARKMLRTLIRERWLQAARRDRVVSRPTRSMRTSSCTPTRRASRSIARVHFLRQQKDLPEGKPHGVAGRFRGAQSPAACATTSAPSRSAPGRVSRRRCGASRPNTTTIRPSCSRSLADRLAEAFAERLHERVRREFWGYAPAEKLGNEQLIREEYRGIRPAPGYPACPDHTEKATLWRLLDVGAARRHHTHRVVCDVSDRGRQRLVLLASGRRATWRSGRIDRDQVLDYARRKGMTVEEVERWLAPNLGYEPEVAAPADGVTPRLRPPPIARGAAGDGGPDVLRGFFGVFRYSRRALELVWSTNPRAARWRWRC